MRSLSFGNYVLYYTSSSGTVYVLRVLHGARQVRPEMFDLSELSQEEG